MTSTSEPRLIFTPPAAGAWNMALDELLLLNAAAEPPVLRIFAWQPPAVSLGYGQSVDDIDRAACAAHGIEVTRRLTGGRAVLHHLEWTYSLVVSAAALGTGRSVAAAYGLLSGGLSAGLARLGIAARCTPRQLGESAGESACFATTLGGDLAVDGRKLVGSAQCHRGGGILQHGSIPIDVDDALQAACLRRPAGSTRGWTSLRELGLAVTADELGEALADGLAEVLGGRPTASKLSDAELAAADALAGKYATEAWITRR